MDIRHHGGMCCGMTHIEGFSYPNANCPEDNHAAGCMGDYHCHIHPGNLCRFGKAPAETAKERLLRMIKFIESRRSQGIIEVVLTHWQNESWKATLEEFNFKLVNKCSNSNSGATLHVWHRNSGEPKPEPKAEKVSLRQGE